MLFTRSLYLLWIAPNTWHFNVLLTSKDFGFNPVFLILSNQFQLFYSAYQPTRGSKSALPNTGNLLTATTWKKEKGKIRLFQDQGVDSMYVYRMMHGGK